MRGRRRNLEEPRDRVGLRLGETERDRALADYIDRARLSDENISELIKALLWAHFTGEMVLPEVGDQPQQTPDQDDPLVAKLLGVRFTGLE